MASEHIRIAHGILDYSGLCLHWAAVVLCSIIFGLIVQKT